MDSKGSPGRKIARWPDGASLRVDPTHQDPLYYYLGSDQWPESIGFEVHPLWEESDSPEVGIVVTKSHRSRLDNLQSSEKTKMLGRTLQALVGRHPAWTRLSLHLAPALFSEDELPYEEMRALGFETEAGHTGTDARCVWMSRSRRR